MAGALQELAKLLATFRKVGPAYDAADALKAAPDLTALAKAASTPQERLLFNGHSIEKRPAFTVPTEHWWGTPDAEYAAGLADTGANPGALHLLSVDPRKRTRIRVPFEPPDPRSDFIQGYHWDPGDLWYRDLEDIDPRHYHDRDTVARAVEKLKAKPPLIEWLFDKERGRASEWTIDPRVPTKRYATGGPVMPSDEELGNMDHASLYMLRERLKDKAAQNALAGWEHRAFGREAVANNPLLAAPIALATPLYQASKLIPGLGSRSDASWEQTLQGWRGVGDGLAQWWRGL